jgi:glutathione peroxidase
MKIKVIAFSALAAIGLSACSKVANETPTSNRILAMNETSSFYDFKVMDLMGNEFDFAALKGKRVLIVNTASKCGFTPQYKELQELYDTYNKAGFEIIGFPANNFASQEPGTSSEIAEFCERNYGVTFSMMDKISVKGKDMHPVYQWLTQKALNGQSDASVKWNFHKFLVDENGTWVASYGSTTSPTSDEIVKFAARK